MCKQILNDYHENLPMLFDISVETVDAIKYINDTYGCHSVHELSRRVVLECFCLGEPIGRICLDRVYSGTAEQKEPLDPAKLSMIQKACSGVITM